MKTMNPKKINAVPISTRMFRTKKGNAPIVMGLAIVGIAAISIGAYNYFTGDKSNAPKLQAVGAENIVQDPGTGDVIAHACGSDKTTNFNLLAYNPLDDDGTMTYVSKTFYAKSANGGALRSYTTDTDGTFAAASLELNCPDKYMVYAPANENVSASAMFELNTIRPTWDDQIEIPQIDHLTVYAYDEKNRGFVYDSAGALSNNKPSEITSALTLKSTVNGTAYVMGNGGSLDYTFTTYTGTAQRQWGDLKNFVLVDADKSDYAAPTVYWNGVALSEVGKTALTVDDAAYLSSYEYVFMLPEGVTEVQKQLRVKINAKSGQDPDVDLKVRFAAESLYVDGTNIKQGIFNAGGNEILATPAQEITIDVS